MSARREMLTELAGVDELGEKEHLGYLAKKRVVGETTVYLTVTEPSDVAPAMWWIVFHDHDGKLCKLGYALERREICWQTWLDMSEEDLVTATTPNPSPPPTGAGVRILALAREHNVITAEELPAVLSSIQRTRDGEGDPDS